MSSVGSFFSYVNDARSHEPEVNLTKICTFVMFMFLDFHTAVCKQCVSILMHRYTKLSLALLTAMKRKVTENDHILLQYTLPQLYTGCPRRNGQNVGRVFLMLNYTDITQNTYIQSWTVTEIMAREVWNFDSCYTLIGYQIHIKTGRNMWFL